MLVLRVAATIKSEFFFFFFYKTLNEERYGLKYLLISAVIILMSSL